MATNRSRRVFAQVAFVAAVVAGLLVLAADAYRQCPTLLAQHAAEALASAPDEELERILRDAVALRDEGLAVLVDALDSDRPIVATRAKAILLEELGQWEGLPSQEGTRRSAILAELLAERIEQFRPAARQHAGELAGELLRVSSDPTQLRDERVVAACEIVLRRTVAEAEAGEVPAPSQAAIEPPRPASETVKVLVPSLRPLPAGGLPLEMSPLPQSVPRPSTLPEPTEEQDQPAAVANRPTGLPGR